MLFRLVVAIALCSVSAFNSPSISLAGSAVAASSSRSALDEVVMGRGDRRTTKGKRKCKSFGNARPRNSKLRKIKEEKASDGSD